MQGQKKLGSELRADCRGRGRGRPLEAELLLSSQGRCLGRPLSGRVGSAPHGFSAGKAAPRVWVPAGSAIPAAPAAKAVVGRREEAEAPASPAPGTRGSD